MAMKSDSCPYCKETIKTNATVCKHCHSHLRPTLKDMALAEIAERIGPFRGPVSAHKAWCYFRYANDKVGLNECLDDADAASALAMAAERLHKELFDSMWEYLLAGGDIDPVPFERSIRERFSRGR
jgi:hypothetical protein